MRMKNKDSNYKRFFRRNFILVTLLFVGTLLLGIGYAQIDGVQLDIEGTALAKRQTGIVITDVTYVSNNSANLSNSSINSFYQSTLNSSIELGTDSSSSITYQVTIHNGTGSKKTFSGIEYSDEFYDNPDIEVVYSGINVGDELEDGEDVTFNITYQYQNTTDNPTLNSYINFVFDTVRNPRFFQLNATCTFNGANETITGEGCEEYFDDYYIDTGVALFSEENYLEDFVLSFDIVHYDVSEQSSGETQQTIMNAKLENQAAGYPGIVFRRKTNSYEITAGQGLGAARVEITIPITTTSFKFIRYNQVLYYSVNDGPMTFFQSNENFKKPFDTPVTFGASLKENGDAFRHVKGSFSNFYVNVAPITTEYITVTFDGRGGTSSSKILESAGKVGSLPTPTRSGYYFLGWYTVPTDGEKITANTNVDADVTYYAHWLRSVTSIKFQPNSLTAEVGDTVQVVVSNPTDIEEEWTYSSLKASIATVDENGLVTAVAAGSTSIRLKGKTSGQTKDISIKVTEPVEPEPESGE